MPISCKKGIHPAEKPVELIKRFVSVGSKEDDTILDPFMGSGTTGIACKELNRNFIGIEKDETYFEMAKSRINNLSYVPKKAEKEELKDKNMLF